MYTEFTLATCFHCVSKDFEEQTLQVKLSVKHFMLALYIEIIFLEISYHSHQSHGSTGVSRLLVVASTDIQTRYL